MKTPNQAKGEALQRIRKRLDDCEATYKHTSEEMLELVQRGEWQETREVCDWIVDYKLWLLIGKERRK